MKKGFTLVEIMIVVAIIGIIIAIAVPAFLRARENARGRACQENLSKVQGAVETYALENKIAATSSVAMTSLVIGTAGTGYLKEEPKCPADATVYIMGATINDAPTCDYAGDTGYIEHVLPTSG